MGVSYSSILKIVYKLFTNMGILWEKIWGYPVAISLKPSFIWVEYFKEHYTPFCSNTSMLSSIHDLDFPSSISNIKSYFFVPLSSYSSHISYTTRAKSVSAFPWHLDDNLFFISEVNSWMSVATQKPLQKKQ